MDTIIILEAAFPPPAKAGGFHAEILMRAYSVKKVPRQLFIKEYEHWKGIAASIPIAMSVLLEALKTKGKSINEANEAVNTLPEKAQRNFKLCIAVATGNNTILNSADASIATAFRNKFLDPQSQIPHDISQVVDKDLNSILQFLIASDFFNNISAFYLKSFFIDQFIANSTDPEVKNVFDKLNDMTSDDLVQLKTARTNSYIAR